MAKNNIKYFNKKRFEELLETKVFGRNLLYFDQIDSTNDYAAVLLDNCPFLQLEGFQGMSLIVCKLCIGIVIH